MADKLAALRTYFRDHWLWIVLVVVISIAVGIFFDWQYSKALKETYSIFAQSHHLDPTPPSSVHSLATTFAIFSAAIFMAVLEVFHFSIHLQQQLLRKLEIDEDDGPRSLWKRLFYRFDPVDEATVKDLRADLTGMTNYFGSITHVNAKRWFAGENYLTLLLCQAHELIRRKLTTPATLPDHATQGLSPAMPELFRIIVWKDQWFNQKQSIALLRILYFFYNEFDIPLKTYILTQRRFNRLMNDDQVPRVHAKEIQVKGQFWVCNRTGEDGVEQLSLVYGKKEKWGATETPERVKDQEECKQCMKVLDYLRSGSLKLETVLNSSIVIYDDAEVRRCLQGALKQLENPIPTY